MSLIKKALEEVHDIPGRKEQPEKLKSKEYLSFSMPELCTVDEKGIVSDIGVGVPVVLVVDKYCW